MSSPPPFIALVGIALLAALPLAARAVSPGEMLAGYAAQAGSPAQATRGQQLFGSRHGREWSCSSCHGTPPVQAGRHVSTGKAIEPLAPAVNAQRFTDAARTEKWFRRNCNDVLGRECTAGEKADLLAWLIALK
jgi:mono/diheme cytochrome c family protein